MMDWDIYDDVRSFLREHLWTFNHWLRRRLHRFKRRTNEAVSELTPPRSNVNGPAKPWDYKPKPKRDSD